MTLRDISNDWFGSLSTSKFKMGSKLLFYQNSILDKNFLYKYSFVNSYLPIYNYSWESCHFGRLITKSLNYFCLPVDRKFRAELMLLLDMSWFVMMLEDCEVDSPNI